VALDVKELNEEKEKKMYTIGYGAIINHFGNVNPYKNLMMYNNKSHGGLVVCYQILHANFYCGKHVVEIFGHALKSSGCISKWEANGLACHLFINGQYHGTICNAN
jgi:hypothetical protein